ncbi:LysM peptidoglycan-binding domain-containing protein, partial [Salmonella sp. NW890]
MGEKFGVTFQEIANRNSNIISNPDLIFPGQRLD